MELARIVITEPFFALFVSQRLNRQRRKDGERWVVGRRYTDDRCLLDSETVVSI
jgi:hypothetical protein